MSNVTHIESIGAREAIKNSNPSDMARRGAKHHNVANKITNGKFK